MDVSANTYVRRCVELCRARGLGRIEVANLSTIPVTSFDLKGAAGGGGRPRGARSGGEGRSPVPR
jgi:hypothetical protein